MLDRAGKKIGTIQDIYLVEETDRSEWASVKLGRLKGHLTRVPLAGARADRDGVRATCVKATVDDAPRIDEEPSPQQVDALYRHYAIQPPQDAAPSTGEAPYDARQRLAAASSAGWSVTFDIQRGPGWWVDAAAHREGVLGRQAAAVGGRSDVLRGAVDLSALLALVSILGLFGSSAIQPMIDNLSKVAPLRMSQT